MSLHPALFPLLLCLAAGAAAAEVGGRGDPALGEYLASECLACHRADGSAQAGIPAITGWRDEDFIATMQAYKLKERHHPVMEMVAGRLTEEEIAALAAWFARPH